MEGSSDMIDNDVEFEVVSTVYRGGKLIYICKNCADKKEFDSNKMMNIHLKQVHKIQILAEDEGEDASDKNEIKFNVPARMNRVEIFEKMTKLNNEQRNIVLHVLNCLKTESNLPVRIFLNGAAGVGKSFVIGMIYQLITNHYDTLPNADPDSIKVLLVAPTGKSAVNINGMTIHSAFKINTRSSRDNLGEKKTRNFRELTKDLKLIIIDEISFVSNGLLDRISKQLNRLCENDSKNFGGFSMIFVGDLLQLPPIGGLVFLPSKKQRQSSDGEFSELWKDFKYFKLTKVMRQSDPDQIQFISALKNVAIGSMTENDVKLILKRVLSDEEKSPPAAIHLFKYNADVDEYNNKRIKEHKGQEYRVEAIDTINKQQMNKDGQNQALNELKKKRYQDTNGLPSILRLKIGIKYMITTNIDTEDGLVNGAVGILKQIIFDANHKPDILLLDLNFYKMNNAGKKTRAKFSNDPRMKTVPDNWVPIIMKTFSLKISTTQINRKQFPVVPAEAQTIHKAQGQTYQEVCLSVRGNTRPMLYVGLSRVTKIKNLYISDEFKAPTKPAANDPTMNFLKELDTNRQLNISFTEMEIKKKNVVVFQNINSFNDYKKLIECDQWYDRVDLLILTEPKVMKSDRIELKNFQLLHRSNSVGDDKSFGLLIYSKATIDIEMMKNKCSLRKSNKTNKNQPYYSEVIVLKIGEYYVITVYRSSSTLDSVFNKQMEKAMKDFDLSTEKILFIGDIGAVWTDRDQFEQLMNKFNLQENYRLDNHVIYVNFGEILSDKYVSYFSKHTPIFGIIGPTMINQRKRKINDCQPKKNRKLMIAD